MFYDRQIKYLDLYDKEEKVQNAGFVRLEARQDRVYLQFRAEKLRNTDNGSIKVILAGVEREAVLGELILENGRGILECRDLPLQDLAGGIGYQEIYDIYMNLPGERMLKCIVREREREVLRENISMSEREPEAVQEEVWEEVQEIGDEMVSESLLFQAPVEEPGSMTEQLPPIVPQLEYSMEKPQQREQRELMAPPRLPVVMEPRIVSQQVSEDVAPNGQSRALERGVQTIPERRTATEPGPVLRPISAPPVQGRPGAVTKWQQLSNIYPHIRPFEDGRDYLKIRPEDFVILTQKYYPLVNNSFLKHGYYNYEHIILTREMRKDGEHFYIGVPGNFYEKEKQVAVLFGFESFEGKIEPAKNGDFGYYMISVEI